MKRNLAIDIFRGLTMVLMVFVNDFWTVPGVPHFLEHFATLEDGMGLSDIVYPMFLFAMGLSVPLALEIRLKKGASLWDCYKHVLERTLALLAMGCFIVNAETGIAWNAGVYWVIMLLGFFLLWGVKSPRALRLAGLVILLGLAVAFRSPEGGLFRASWWGILGQIGWMYLFTAVAYLLFREKPWVLAVLWGAFCLVNLSVAPLRGGGQLLGGNILADLAGALQLGNGHSVVMSLGGTLTVLAGMRLQGRRGSVLYGLGAAGLLALMGLATHQGWIISKNLGTLPWCLYVSAISVALYTLLRWLEARGHADGLARLVGPAGTATLTVYMIPYLFVALWIFVQPSFPAWVSGWVGVGKCALYTVVVMVIARILTKAGIKLKI